MILRISKAAKQYAKALFVSCELEELEQVRQALATLAQAQATTGDLAEGLDNPVYPLDVRINAAHEVGASVLPGKEKFSNFLKVLTQAERVALLPEITQEFSRRLDELKKLLFVEITSAFELSEDEKREVMGKVQNSFGSLASFDWRIDERLLGGIQIRCGDLLYDGSVEGRLEKLKREFISAAT